MFDHIIKSFLMYGDLGMEGIDSGNSGDIVERCQDQFIK